MSTTGFRSTGRRGRALAAALALAASLGAAGCGRKQVPAEEYDPDAPKAAPAPPAPPGAPEAAAPAAAPAPLPTPEEDSAAEAALFARRQRSMESYEQCMAKAEGLEDPARTTIRQACARRRDAGG